MEVLGEALMICLGVYSDWEYSDLRSTRIVAVLYFDMNTLEFLDPMD